MMTQEERIGLIPCGADARMGKDYREMKICCGNCLRFISSGKTNATGEWLGWCDNWGVVEITTESICSPSGFIPKHDFKEKKGE